MRFLDPKNDVAFKKIFGSEQRKNITISFLNAILEYTGDREIKTIHFMNNEQSGMTTEKKENILDIACIDQSGHQFIVEMQVNNVKSFDKRALFYGAKTYAMQLGKSQAYYKLAPVTVVAVVNFIMFPHKMHYKSLHKIMDTQTYENDITDLSLAFVELPKFTKKDNELNSVEEKWLYFIKQISKQEILPKSLSDGVFEEACHVAERMTWSELEYNLYERQIILNNDYEGALEEALEKGEMQAIVKVVKKMFKEGFDSKLIALVTGLTIDEINSIKN